jgi:predicted Ser/Thr protein kinase
MPNPEAASPLPPRSPLEILREGRAKPWRRLPGRNSTKADVLLYRLDGGAVAVKDYGSRSFAVRNTVGRFLIRREARAYRAASGLPGLPRFLGRLGPFSLAMEYVDARPLAEISGRTLDAAFFDRLEAAVRAFHARGIALGDLHHRDVLVTTDDTIYLVDLAMAWVAGPRAGKVRRAIFERLAGIDLVAVARMRARWTGQGADPARVGPGGSAVAWHARGRRLKTIWNRIRRRNRAK